MALILLTVAEASKHFYVHKATLYRWIQNASVSVVELRNKKYLLYDEIERLAEERAIE